MEKAPTSLRWIRFIDNLPLAGAEQSRLFSKSESEKASTTYLQEHAVTEVH